MIYNYNQNLEHKRNFLHKNLYTNNTQNRSKTRSTNV